jgi:hypothetical protein
MTVVGPRSRIGAAAVLVGLSLISTPAAGVAAADDSDQSGSGPAAGSAAQQNTPTRGAARGSRSAAAPSPSLPPAAARSVSPRSAATSTPHRAATNPEPRAAAARSGPAPTTELPRTASAVASPAATTQSPPAESATSSSPAAPAPAATPATSTLVAPAKATTPLSPCAACWGFTAPSITQAVTTVVNHLFNNAFNALAGFPANPISNLVEGALVLIRRSLFGFVPTGVTANQDGNALGISVNSGSVAYFRNNNGTLEVAGDPGFSHAQTFTDSSVSQVLATGNGGCAGLAVTSGLIGAGLVTDGIDALRFGSAANVTGLTVAAGTTQLHISDAIRGMQGVVLAAPVVLDRDTEVDAGGGSAQFAGPVDGSGWFGGQSLTVTALGTTDFLGDVGADKPLGNLTTRGIAPLKITQSADTRTIPLYYMPESAGPGQFNIKYGIDVAFGDSPSRRYLFDTGGNGFFAFNNPGYLDGTTLGTDSVDITYSNGQTYEGVVASASKITIGTGVGLRGQHRRHGRQLHPGDRPVDRRQPAARGLRRGVRSAAGRGRNPLHPRFFHRQCALPAPRQSVLRLPRSTGSDRQRPLHDGRHHPRTEGAVHLRPARHATGRLRGVSGHEQPPARTVRPQRLLLGDL